MKKDDTVYLRHILDAIARITKYLRRVSEQQFRKSDLLQDAVVRQLEIIGEASRNLSDEFRDKHAQTPWSQIIGLPNRIVHDYVNVDTEIVWEVAQNDLPALQQQIALVLQQNQKGKEK